MEKKYSKLVKKSAWLAVIIFAIGCCMIHPDFLYDFSLKSFYSYVVDCVMISAAFIVVYEKWLWKIDPFENTPVLKKNYKGTVMSSFDNLEREGRLEIKQTLLKVSITFLSDESKSNSITASIEKIDNEWKLIYCYMNTPDARVRERSKIHYGTAMLCIENVNKLKGQYYTDRKTLGDMNFVTEEQKN